MKKKSMKKFLLCIITVLCCSLNFNQAKAYSQQEAVNYLKGQIGKSIDLDGNGAWCVDLIVAYLDYLGVPRVWGNANEYQWKTPSGFTRLSPNNEVQAGDILVTTGINSYMHVNVVVSNNNGVIRTVDQNFNGMRYVTERTTRKSEIVSILRPNLTSSGQWIKDNTGWWYKYSNGNYPYSKWEKIDDKWYYFNEKGYMVTGWIELSNKWYYLKESGEMATGWIKLLDKWYYLKESGEMATGWIELSNKWYYLKESGEMATGWIKPDHRNFYLKEDGVMASNETLKIGENTYTFNSNGEIVNIK